MDQKIYFPAEWEEQDAVMLTWPNSMTDWADILMEAEQTYLSIAKEIVRRQQLIVVCNDRYSMEEKFSEDERTNIRFYEIPYNDTWARDHGPIITFRDGNAILNDFGFNGWGGKFDARLDNLISESLYKAKAFHNEVIYRDLRDFVLEGGSIESDGKGTILTTEACLLNVNRNPQYGRTAIEDRLRETLGATRILWLKHGFLEGDDTDSHIDTLARFCDEETICYVQCTDPEDPHYPALRAMEEELRCLKTQLGNPYRLVPLPMVSPLLNSDGERMGATYANFLIMNGAVLVPVYGTPEDNQALEILSGTFSDRNVVGINCLPLVKQNGSLHCITMQIPKGVIS